MDIEKLDSWYSLLRAIPATGLLLLIAQFLGCGLIAWTRVLITPSQRSWQHFHFAAVLGLNLLGFLALAAGWLPSLVKNVLFLSLSLLSGYWAVRRLINTPPSTAQVRATLSWSSVLMVVPLAFTLGPALTYPSGWDELTYHIELPRRWTIARAYDVQLDLPYSALPSLLEIIFTLTYPIEGLITPRLLTWIIWLHGLFLFRDVCGRVCSRRSANCLAIALVASPMALFISANCYVESLIWANVACLLHRIVARTTSTQFQWRQAMLLGVLIGGTLAIKITSVGLLCVPLLLVVWRSHQRQFDWPGAMIASLTAACFAAPFYVRTWWLTGNPVAPFYAEWFTSDAATIECSRYHHDLAVDNFGMHGLSGFVVGPGALAFANELYDGALGWQWLAMLLLFGVASVRSLKADRAQRTLLMLFLSAALLFYGLWFITSQQARFAIPLVMTVVLAAGVGIDSFRVSVQHWLRWSVLALSLVSIPWNNFGYYLDSWLCVLKARAPLDYLRDGVTDSYAELAIYLQEHAPADAKILSLFEHRLAYLPASVEIATPYFQSKHFRLPMQQSDSNLMDELRTKGIQYIILTSRPLGPDVSPDRIAAQQAWYSHIDSCIATGRLKVIWKSEFHAVAAVEPSEH